MVVALAGCASKPAGDDPVDAAPADAPDDVQTPVLCPTSIPLAPGSPGTPAGMEVGPLELGTASFCLHLDTRGLIRGHFMAGTSLRESGDASSFTLTLADTNGTTLVEGWDVSIGNTDTKTFANLEMAMEADLERDVVLTISAKGGTAPVTNLGFSLFDPLL